MTVADVILRKVRNFGHLPTLIRLGLLPTWLLLGLARMLVLCIPFRMIAPRLGRHAGPHAFVPLIPSPLVAQARQIARLIQIAARYCPWRANCFAQAIAARVWLKGLGIPHALYFGVRKDAERRLKAHAWVCAGPVFVTGGGSFGQFTVVGTFVSYADMPERQ